MSPLDSVVCNCASGKRICQMNVNVCRDLRICPQEGTLCKETGLNGRVKETTRWDGGGGTEVSYGMSFDSIRQSTNRPS